MPCSLSALSPSVSRARSILPSSRLRLCFSRASSWSVRMFLLSKSKRPIRVLLPSSTLPAVINRKRSINVDLEITILFSVFHRCFGNFVVNACLSALTRAGKNYFINNVIQCPCIRFHRRRAGHVAHGAVAHIFRHDLVRFFQLDERRNRDELAFVRNDFAFMRKVNSGQFDLLTTYIIPDVQFGPVTYWKYPHIFPFLDLAILY